MAVDDAGGSFALASPGVAVFSCPGEDKASDGIARPFPFAGVGVDDDFLAAALVGVWFREGFGVAAAVGGGFAEVPFPFEALFKAFLGAEGCEDVFGRFFGFWGVSKSSLPPPAKSSWR